MLSLVNAIIDSAENGRGTYKASRSTALMAIGLQCHTSQFTWKLIFHAEGREYEILLSACSEMEEESWKAQLRDRIGAETSDFANWGDSHDLFSMNFQDIKYLGHEFVPSANFSRTRSIKRSATVHEKSGTHQVIIKNTEALKYANPSSFSVVRSQSHLSSNYIPILTPRRDDRERLELALADVWTRESLKYPGMGPRRGDNPIRASANSVMRRLSMASIASNFSKRSISHATNDGYASSIGSNCTSRARRVSSGKKHPVLVDFHTAPNAFLPVDFELNVKPTRRARKVSARLSIHDAARATFATPTPAATTEDLLVQSIDAADWVAKPVVHRVHDKDGKASKSSSARTESPVRLAELNEKRPGSAGSAARRLVMARGLFRLFK
jgi:hypothetical protein